MANWIFLPLLKNLNLNLKDTAKLIHEWVAEEDKPSRAALGEAGMAKEYRQKALEDLAASTHVKQFGGENHYLLHRTMGNEEAVSHIKNGAVDIPPVRKLTHDKSFTNFTSWGPSVTQIPRDYRNRIVSAWVPESHISFYPMAYKKHFETMFPSSDANEFMIDEQEAIVKPGKFAMVHSHIAPSRRAVNGEMIHHLTYQDVVNYEMDLRNKLNGVEEPDI